MNGIFGELLKEIFIHTLPAKSHSGGSDRRGPIVSLYTKVPLEPGSFNEKCLIRELLRITVLLNSTYTDKREPEPDEHNECFIHRLDRCAGITVHHKYWSQEQVEVFVRILTTLALFQQVEIVDDGIGG